MAKTQNSNLPKKLISAAIIIAIAFAAYYFIPWDTKDVEKKPYSPHHNAHYIIPEISSKSPIIQDTFERGDIKCITTYNITTTLPIYITRYYPNENRTEYLILRPLDLYHENITAMYQLIQNSKEHIGAFEPQVVDMYDSKVKTRYRLWQQSLRMGTNPRYLTLGIWYKKEGENTERLIGSVTVDPHNQTEEAAEKGIPAGVYGSYFTGDPIYTEVHGVARISFEALVNHLIYTGKIEKNIFLVIDKKNKGSSNIAVKLHCKRYEADEIYPEDQWQYPADIDKSYIYKISVKKWKKYNWQKKQVKINQVPAR